MGFFYSGDKGAVAKRTAKRAPMRPAAPNTKNAETLNRLGCRACPLDKADVCTPKMQPTLAKQSLVYFLDEFPTKYEDERSGKPLTSDAGELLRECIPEGEERYCAFDNMVRDRPPDNREPSWQEVECCRSNVTKSIEEAKPTLIVGLGIIPLKAFLNSADMMGMRGRLFAVKVGTHNCWYMPIYHPKFIIKHAFDQDKPLQSKLGHAFRMDLRRAFKILGKLQPPHIDTAAEVRANIEVFTGGPGQLQKLLGRISEARKAAIKAIDLETYPLRPYAADARLLTAALTWGTTNVAFALDHPKAGWSPGEKEEIKQALRPLLMDDTIKVAHNAPFEIEWLVSYYKDMTIVRHEVWECTQMQAHFIDERRGREAGGDDDAQARRAVYQSLNFLCKQHFGVAYKSMFKLDKKDMRKADLKETLIYNGADTKYTLRLYYHQLKLLKQNDVLDAYYEAILRQPTVALMQYIGAPINKQENEAAAKRLMEGFDDSDGVHIDGIRETMEAINNLKVIKEYNRRERAEFNPLSAPDLLKVFRDYLKRPEIKATVERDREGRERTKFALDKAVLDTIDHPLAEHVLTLRNRTKLKSTYVDCFEAGKGAAIWPDGRIHTNFNTTFAETGRTSSDEPNQQNWPKRRDAWVRKQVATKKGYVFLAFDYGQLEGCTSAVCSGDKVMIKALWENYDFHMEWAHKLAALYPQVVGGSYSAMKDKKVAKNLRGIAKNKLVFPAIFGAQDSSIHGYLVNATNVDIPEKIITKLMNEFWSTFSGLRNWQDKTMKRYYDEGFVVSPTGRKHWYPLTRNQAINFPIQSFGADIVCDAMCRLSEMAVRTGKWHLHPVLNIHDDLTFIIPDDNDVLEDAINTIYRAMLTVDYKCINVPLSVEASWGDNWFEMKDIGKFWSHKDL